MTTEEKFNAAVNVIKSLPKNGAYQPSNELMLKFYSYFKQATEGPCKSPKPAFWEVVKKAKWDAWTRLGDMGREEAMARYVIELKKVVEAMSGMENVASYADDLDSFNRSVPVQDLELVVGPVLERIRSQSNSPVPESGADSCAGEPSRTTTTCKINGESAVDDANAYSAETETEDEFIDTVESAPLIFHKKFSKTHVKEQEEQEQEEEEDEEEEDDDQLEHRNSKHPLDRSSLLVGRSASDDKNFVNQVAITLKSLQRDLDQVMIRVANVEQQVMLLTKNQVNSNSNSNSNNNNNNNNNTTEQTKNFGSGTWWPLPKNSSQLLVLIILWPFVAQFFVFLLKRCHRRQV